MKNFIFFLLILLLFSSCKKSQELEEHPVEKVTKGPNHYPEVAFPGLSGTWDSAYFRGTKIYVEKKGENYVWLSDIVFDQETFNLLKHNIGRTFQGNSKHYWPRGVVYFTIGTGFSQAEIGLINDAIEHWRTNTSLRFAASQSQPNRIEFRAGASGSGLYSDFIGMKGGRQIINLERGVFILGNVIHEIGHAIGFYHEQSRNDRNNFIQVFYNNVVPNNSNTIYQFRTYTEQGSSGSQIGTFDFQSIMLYSSFAFSDNIHPTMTRLDGSIFFAQRNGLSLGDIETSNFLYGPPFARLEKIVTYEWSDPFDAAFEERGEIYLNFYSDVNCTIPAVLDQRKSFRFQKSVSQKQNGGNEVYSVNEEEVFLSPGKSRYHIADYFDFDDSYRGYSNNFNITDFYGLSGYMR